MFLQNSTGNLRIAGNFTANGAGLNTLEGDLRIKGGDLEVQVPDPFNPGEFINSFKVENDGSIDFANQTGFFTPSGARKWVYISGGTDIVDAQSNVNYFADITTDTIFKLPQNPTTGDIIRVIDVGGQITFNVSLRFRAPDGVSVQGDGTNSGQGPNIGAGYDGGELVVQTPNAGLGLAYLGQTDYDGTPTGAGGSKIGWWLIEI